jgi:hypothetical protein
MNLSSQIKSILPIIERAEIEELIKGRREAIKFIFPLIEEWQKMAKGYYESPHSYSPVDIADVYIQCSTMLKEQLEKIGGADWKPEL